MNIIQQKLEEHMDYIKSCYAEPHRHYHTWQHIEEMLKSIELPGKEHCTKELIDTYWALKAAIYFHDIVYDPRSNTNEEDSVNVFLNTIGQHIPEEWAAKICNAIIATKHNVLWYDVNPNFSAALCRADLNIFHKPVPRLMEFEDQIRKEYAWVPKDIYLVERQKILEKFHAKPEHIAYMLHTIGKE